MSTRSRWSRWIAAVVAAGLLAMHGAAGDHGSTAMGPSMTMVATHDAGLDASRSTSTRPAVLPAPRHMTVHAMMLCVALPVGFLLLILAVTLLSRRRRQPSFARWWRPIRTARAPPCPPPHVRGVCLT